MTNRVDPGMQQMKAPGTQPHFDRPSASSKRGKLTPRHHPMLTLGQLGDSEIQSTRLL